MVYRNILQSYAIAYIPIKYIETLTSIEKSPNKLCLVCHAIYDILKPLVKF